MQLCISSLAWDNTDRLFVYQLLQKLSIPYLEIVLSKFTSNVFDEPLDFYLEKKQEWESFGLQALSLQSIHFGIDNAFLFGTEKQKNNLLLATKKIINIASVLGITNLVFGSPKLRIIPTEGSSTTPISFFDELNQYAHKKNCFINIEANSHQYGTNFLTTTNSVKEFISTHSWSNIGINLDLSTIILEKENITDLFQDIHHVNHAHISIPFLKTNFDDYRQEIQNYISEYSKVCEPLQSTNTKILSIEMVSQTSDLKLIKKTIKLVQEYL
ncbi:MAG: hypothetical protein ACRCWI_00115 [Brevinema sp.]